MNVRLREFLPDVLGLAYKFQFTVIELYENLTNASDTCV